MRPSDFEHFRDLLLERQACLGGLLKSAAVARRDDVSKVQDLLLQIKEALGRVEDKSYGCCTVCQDETELYRLELQPVTQICIDCITDAEKAELENDLFLAGKVHRALLPQTIPEIAGFDIEAKSHAASAIGGDYYDFIKGSNGDMTRVVIADAMGHGLAAGLLMSNLQGALRILAADINSPASLLQKLNHWICRNVAVTKFISLVCLCLESINEKETRLIYANAGHPPPILVRSDGSVERLDVTGGVLGVHEEFIYEECGITLHSGDFLLVYTDGITEAPNEHGELFNDNRLIEFARHHRGRTFGGILDNLIREIMVFSGAQQTEDDLTIIILRKK